MKMNTLFIKRIIIFIIMLLFFVAHIFLAMNYPILGFDSYGDPIIDATETLGIDEFELAGWGLFVYHLIQFCFWFVLSLIVITLFLLVWWLIDGIRKLYIWLIVEPFKKSNNGGNKED